MSPIRSPFRQVITDLIRCPTSWVTSLTITVLSLGILTDLDLCAQEPVESEVHASPYVERSQVTPPEPNHLRDQSILRVKSLATQSVKPEISEKKREDQSALPSPPLQTKIQMVGPSHPLMRRLSDGRTDQSQKRRFINYPLTQPIPTQNLRTTSCDLFLRNLKSRLNTTRTLYRKSPQSIRARSHYASSLYTMGQIHQNIEVIARALNLTEEGLKIHPDSVRLRRLRIRIAMTLHRINLARIDLDWLEARLPQHAPMHKELAIQRAELDLQIGSKVEHHLERMQLEYKQANYDGYVRAAKAREMRGHLALAQRYYGQAERRFGDVSPIPLAWLNVQRGLMAMHSGNYKSALTFFKTAYERCPLYPMAIEHLAEIEGRLGNLERASQLYETVIKQSDNPEFIAALAEIYRQRGMKAQSLTLTRRADQRFRSLFKRMPEAILGHAADFYLGLGRSPEFALKLLRHNHQLKPNAYVKQKLAEALVALERWDEAKHIITESLENPIEFAEKYWTAARVALGHNKKDQARKWIAHARKLNPRIADLEGKISLD